MIEVLLDRPFFFNSIRRVIAGDQHNTKAFISETLKKYNVKSVLDIGCGTGDFCVCAPKGAHYTGADLNDHYIRYASQRYGTKNKTWITQDVTEKSFYDGRKYDAVLFVSMVHHLSNQELNAMLPVIKKMTRKVIIIADIIPEPPGFLRKFMVKLDQGKYIRAPEDKLAIIEKYGKIVYTEHIPSRLAIQYGIICQP